MDDKPLPKEICKITLTFPVESDEKALELKKKISEVIAELSDAQVQFSLMNMPTRPPMG